MAIPCFYLTATPSVTACRQVPHPFTFLQRDMLAARRPRPGQSGRAAHAGTATTKQNRDDSRERDNGRDAQRASPKARPLIDTRWGVAPSGVSSGS